ncbi:MAG: aspartate kinase [Candidatus Euphemobacter frigidus]|nr:aspartate kinase [Candidatus Euphemobacter frigidus]MDP8275294.1 aspartate kinase [Candidatus Euphemobacter frigidus]
MNITVQKYGGTSVADIERIKDVARRVIRSKKPDQGLVVVVSAMEGTTDDLIRRAEEITPVPSEREMDQLISTGEQISAALLTMAIQYAGFPAVSLTGIQVGILTDDSHTKARIFKIDPRKIFELLDQDTIVVVAGFQGINLKKDVTTLGRGGSDTTAVALAAVLKAEVCEIYTDVAGVYTADPRIVPGAFKLDRISYDEMLELASLGAKVIQNRAVEFAKKFHVTLHVRSSFIEDEGTFVTEEVDTMSMEQVVIRGVTLTLDEAKLTITLVPDTPGIAAHIFKSIAQANINVDMIIQNVSEKGFTDVSFTVPRPELVKTKNLLENISGEIRAGKVTVEEKIAKVSIVGVGMKSHPGVAAIMFEALAEEGINIMMISTSEIKISCVVRAKDGERAVRALHQAFDLDRKQSK